MSARNPNPAILEPTTLGSSAPVLALVRDGVSLPVLARALAACEPKPRAVLVRGPVPLDWLDAIMAADAEVWLVLRQVPNESLRAWLRASRERVRVMLAVMPGSAPVGEWLARIDTLQGDGLRVQVSLEPLIHGKTDTRAVLGELLAGLAERGLRQVSMGYLALDQPTEDWVLRTQGEDAGLLLAQYREGPMGQIPGRGAVRLLPRNRRQRCYAGLHALAAEHGLQLCISPLANPDFDRPRNSAPPANRQSLSDAYLAGGLPRRLEALL